MPTRSFAIEDGNLNARSLVTSRNKLYKDIDLTFTANAVGDVYKKNDAGAVKQAVMTLLMTNHGEKPFRPRYGANLQALLFNLTDEELVMDIRTSIKEAMTKWEPRAKVLDIKVSLQEDVNNVFVTTTFQIKNTEEVVTVRTSLSRLR